MKFGVLVDFPRTFPQPVGNCVEKMEFSTGLHRNVCGFFQNFRTIRIFSKKSPSKAGVQMWKTVFKPCEQKNFSPHIPQKPVDSFRSFSTEIPRQKFHNDNFRGPDYRKTCDFAIFRRTTGGFPKTIPQKYRGSPQENLCRPSKKSNSINDISLFHSFHPLYGYYCWYSQVFLCKVSCCQTRGRACRPL